SCLLPSVGYLQPSTPPSSQSVRPGSSLGQTVTLRFTWLVPAEQPGLVGEYDRLYPVTQAKLLQDVRDVRLHGRLADEQRAADLRIGQAGGDQPEDLEFPFGELAQFLRRCGPRYASELPDHALGDGGRQQRVAGGDGADRAYELLGR